MSETIREEKAVNSTDAPGLNFESPNKRFDPATLEALRVLQSITKPDLFAADPALAEHAQTLLSLKTSLPPPTSSLLLPPQPVGDVRTSDIAAVAVAKSAIPVSLDIFPSPTPTPVVSHTHQFVPSTYVTCDHIVSSQPTQSSNQQSQQATKLRSETTMEGNNNGYPHSIEMMEDHQFDEQSDQPPLTLPEHSQLSLPVLAATELAKPVTTVAPAVQQQEPVVSPVKPQQTGAPAFNVPQDPRLPAASSATNQQQQQQQQQRPQRHPLPPRPTFALPPRPPTGLWAQHYQSSSSQPGPGSSNSGISFMQEEVVEEVSSGSVPPGQPQRSFSDPASQPYDPLNPDSTDHSVSSMGAPSSSSFSGPTAAASNGAVEDLQHNTPDMNAAGSASPSSSTLSPLLSGSIGETPVPLFTIDKTRSDSNAMVVDGPTTPSTGMSTDTGVDAVMKQGSQPPIPAASAPGSNIAGTGPNKKNGTGGGGGPSGGNKKDRTALTGDPHQFHPTHTVTFAAHPSVIGKLPPGSRLFLGNLASERTDKGEVASIFAQYGNIVEILFKGSYGFIQYDNPTSCREAIRCEQGRVLGGINLDLKISRDKNFNRHTEQNEEHPSPNRRQFHDRNERGGGGGNNNMDNRRDSRGNANRDHRDDRDRYDDDRGGGGGRRNRPDSGRPGPDRYHPNDRRDDRGKPYDRGGNRDDRRGGGGGGGRGNNNNNRRSPPPHGSGSGGGGNSVGRNKSSRWGPSDNSSPSVSSSLLASSLQTASALGSMGGARSSSSLSLPGGAAPTTQQQLAQLLGSGGNASTLGAGGGAAQQRFGGTGGGDGMSNMLATLQNAFMQQQQQQQQQQQAGLKADEFPLPRRYGNQVPECQVIVLGEVDRKFIWHIEGVMKGTGITTETLFLSPKLSLRAVVQQMIAEGVRGVLFLERQHERAGTVSMQVFGRDGGVSEYDNIRLQDAAAIMLRERELRGHPGGNPAAPPAVNNALNNLFGQPQAPHPSLGPALGAGAGLNVSSIATVLSTLAASGGADPATLMNLVTALQAASSQQQQQQQQPQANAALAGLLPGLAAAAAAPNAGAGGMGFGGLPPGLAGLAGLAGLQQQQQQQQPPQLAPQQPGVNQQAGGMAQLLTTLLGAGAAGPAAAAAMGLGNATMGHAPQAGAQQPGPFGSALPRMGLGGPESGNAPGSLPPTSASLGAPSAPSNTSAGGAGSNASGGPRNAGSGPSQNQGNGPQAVGDILNRLKELSQMQQTLQTVSGPGASAPTTIHANQAVSQPGGLPGLLTANVSSMGAPGQQQQHQPGGQRGRVGGPSPTIASGGPLGMAPTSAAPPGSAAVAAAAQQLGNGMNAQQLMSLLQGLASNAANRPGGK